MDMAPYWADHRFQGRAVLPAVEAMQLLAHWTRRQYPQTDVLGIGRARFDKFLELPTSGYQVAVYCDLTDPVDGVVRAALVTKVQSKSAKITRAKIHAQVDFIGTRFKSAIPTQHPAADLTDCRYAVDPQRLYKELVPFGPHYRNICKPLRLSPQGALADIAAPDGPDIPATMPLGSPFVLDAAFHAACVWGQRYADIVAFPVGIEERMILKPTRPGRMYVSRVFSNRTQGGLLVFDIRIFSPGGEIFEILNGVQMRDVSGGRWRPPEWIRAET